MFNVVICCILVISVGLAVTLPVPVPVGSGIYQDFFQGDIKLSEKQKAIFSAPGNDSIAPRTGWTIPIFRWPRNEAGNVIVPFNIDARHGFTSSEIDWMISEFRTIEARTCIRFVQRTNQVHFVDIINGEGCWSWLGRLGGRQEMYIGRASGCVSPGIAVHEAIHALGYDHMHNSVDRDRYVRILWQNIDANLHSEFNIVNPLWFSNFGTPYDLRSVVHYARWAFSMNGGDAIQTLDNSYINVIGQTRISDGDVLRLNRMYDC